MRPTGGVFLAFVGILVLARAVSALVALARQPPVVGELLAGILVGTALFGRIWPEAAAYLQSPEVTPGLDALAKVGVVLYMFAVGLELDRAGLRERLRASVAVAAASVALPLALGAAMGTLLHARFAGPRGSALEFALYLGIAFAVTALPVLARIVRDLGLESTRAGSMALGCAALNDFAAWTLLALVTSLAQHDLLSWLGRVAASFAYVALMVLVARLAIPRWAARAATARSPARRAVAGALGLALVSAVFAELVGVHAVFGAFLAGVLLARDRRLAQALVDKIEDVTVLVFLPVFFVQVGLQARVDLVAGQGMWPLVAIAALVASAGKIAGAALTARASGLQAREALTVGILMNTRGLMELVVLYVGLDAGLLSPELYAVGVLATLVMTAATTPLVQVVSGAATRAVSAAAAARDG